MPKFVKNLLIFSIIFFSGVFNLQAENRIPNLGNLDLRSNQTLINLRKDVINSLQTVRSNRCESELPPLRFYRYTVERGETFWTILSKTNLDMDTLISVNDLSSPYEIKPGATIFIPNMRGIIFSDFQNTNLTDVLRQNRISLRYVKAVNGHTGEHENINSLPLFIPCAQISQTERSLFLGTGFVSPIQNGRVTSGFGDRQNPFDRQRTQFHKGIDIACPIGTRVHAARSGEVVFSGWKGGYGKTVIIQHELGYQSIYGHLSKSLVRVGQRVRTGSVIALSGNTGRTTGPHLHFEVRKNKQPINPNRLLRTR